MATRILMVPMRLNALVLSSERAVLSPSADFSRLPWTDGARDVNARVPYLGESISAQPFRDTTLVLKAGIHLHWLIPKGLCGGANDGVMLRVPNRWLITRRLNGRVERSLVESDYLAAEGEGSGVGYPVAPQPGSPAPYRRLGRAMPLMAWPGELSGAERLERLTAIGYGEPTFASYYPNCCSVFGFHDPDASLAADLVPGLQYEVLGWYSDPAQDELHRLMRVSGAAGLSPERAREGVEEAFGWTYPLPSDTGGTDEDGDSPQQLVCFGRVTFATAGTAPENPSMNAPIRVGMGQTGVEALSAFTGAEIDARHQPILEDQLVAMSLGAAMGHHLIDIGPRFAEARHLLGFNAASGGTRFVVSVGAASATQTPTHTTPATLPEHIGAQLNRTNALQAALDERQAQLEAQRRQLFTDWAKWMLTAHGDPGGARPDPDAIAAFLRDRSLPAIAIAAQSIGSGVQLSTNDAEEVRGARAAEPDTLSARVAEAINELVAEIDLWNGATAETGRRWVCRISTAPRFVQPAEPVVLLSGGALTPAVNFAAEGLLSCPLAELEGPPIGALETLEQVIDGAAAGGGVGFNTWTGQPWAPLRLDWSVEVAATRRGGNLDTPDRAYEADFIERNYALAPDAQDLSPRPGGEALIRGSSVYSGTSLLSAYANPQLQEGALSYLMEQDKVLNAFYSDNAVPEADQNAAWISANIALLDAWYLETYLADASDEAKARDPVYTSIRALGLLPELPCLTQALSGFNTALLMRQEVLELPVADPQAFAGAAALCAQVSDAVGSAARSSPQPNTDFHPIRAGAVRVAALRLIDSYGRFRDLIRPAVCLSAPMSLDADEGLFRLLPRLTQPARLGLYFRAPSGEEVETNVAPATSPICGWLLLNRLEQSIDVYDASGVALGAVQCMGGAPWVAPPGQLPMDPAAIADPTLRRVVGRLVDSDPAFRPAFYAAVAESLNRVLPMGLESAPGLATLIGRPLAVGRALVGLELQGLPAIQQSWNALRQDMRSGARRDDRFPSVRFPVRVGDAHRLNDGLIGYWVETKDGALTDPFHAPKASGPPVPAIRPADGTPDNLSLSPDGEVSAFTLIFDPIGVISVTCGLTPPGELSVPGDQFHAALQAMEASFFAGPVLTLSAQMQLPLREAPGMSWSWLEATRDGWEELSSIGVVRRLRFLNVFGPVLGAAIWDALVACAWILPPEDGADSATVTPKDQRLTPLDDAVAPYSIAIEALLLRAQIGPTETRASFTGPSSLHEGWLKLKPLPESTDS